MIRRSAITGDRVAVLQRAALQDARLSFRALGILCYVLSRPPDWHTSAEQLSRERKEGRDAIRTALRELEACGYLHRYTARDERGLLRTHWDLSDEPQPPDGQDPENGITAGRTDDGFPAVGSPAVGPPAVLLGVDTGSRDTPPTPSPAPPPPSPTPRQEEEPEPAGRKTMDRTDRQALREGTQGLRTALAAALDSAGAGGLAEKARSASGRPIGTALERLWTSGTTERELGAAVRGREWDGVGLGAVVVWLRGLDPAELLYRDGPAVPPAVARARPAAVEGVPVPADFRARIGRTR